MNISKRLFSDLGAKEKVMICGASLLFAISALSGSGMIYLSINMIEKIPLEGVTLYTLIPYWIGIGILLLLKAGGEAVGDLIKHYLGFKVVKSLREKITLRLKKFSLGFYTKERLGEISTIVHKDVDAMEMVVAHIWTRMFASLTVSLVIGIIIFIADWRMGLAMISLIPFAFLFLIAGTRKNSNRYKENQNIMVTMLSRFLEYTRGIPVLKTFRKNRSFEDKLDESVKDFSKTSAKLAASISLVTAKYQFCLELSFAVLATIGVYFATSGSLSPWSYLLFIIFSKEFYKPFFDAEGYWLNYIVVTDSYKRILKIFDAPLISDNGKQSFPEDCNITVKNMSFTYDNGNFQLENINIDVPEGSLTALVGPSGSGKSTLTNLILRFYDPHKGQIQIGGTDIRNIPYDDFLSKISIVMQNVELFSGTIYDNLLIGNPGATTEEIREAAEKAMIHEFIESLPQGYNTILGENGSGLSGGQKQRLSIARAFLKDAKIVILDEATSNVDPVNERKIQKAISNLGKGRTLLVVAHHLNTIRNANQIVVFNQGYITETGKHEELLENGGLYSSLWSAQNTVIEEVVTV